MTGEPQDRFGYWLRIQIGMAIAGIVVWVTGVVVESSFLTGAGTGIMVSALVTRFLRGRPPEPGGDGA